MPPDSPTHKTDDVVLLNGCWDLAHVGHFNAIRQVKMSHKKVVVGVHKSEDISKVKGGVFILSDDEKEEMLRACRWVDDIVFDVPYENVKNSIEIFRSLWNCWRNSNAPKGPMATTPSF